MRFFAMLAFMFSTVAYANCPELSGTYQCTYANSPGVTEVITVGQEIKDGITIYNYNGQEFPADNIDYSIPDDDYHLTGGKFRAWCEELTVKGKLTGQAMHDGDHIGDLDLNMTISKTDNVLKSIIEGTMTTREGGVIPLREEITCTIQ